MERQTLISSTWKNSSALLSSFSACQFMFCTFSSIFLLNMGTTALHLSLLSGNFYTLIVGILLFNYKVLLLQYYKHKNNFVSFQFHALYFLSFTLSMTGVYIYSIKKTSTRPVRNGLTFTRDCNHQHSGQQINNR